jgi:hypothetical protein
VSEYQLAVIALLLCKTEWEVRIARKRLRPLCDSTQLMIWGFRLPRKRRAPSNHLIAPDRDDLTEARDMLNAYWLAHDIEQYFAAMGVRMSRNKLSRMCGARP